MIPEAHPEILRDYPQEKRIEQVVERMKYQKVPKLVQSATGRGRIVCLFTREIPLLRQLGEVRIGKNCGNFT